MGQKYKVFAGAGDRPATLTGQFIEKNSGQSVTDSGTKTQYTLQPQSVGIPNSADIWAVRLDKNGKIPEKVLDVKDTNYSGKIKILKWGDPQGSLIPVRFLQSYATLDTQYQNLILNADKNINDNDASSADAFFITLTSGVNEFDEDIEPYKIQFLKASPYNKNSVSKDPRHFNSMFEEYKDEFVESENESFLDSKFEALKIVNEAGLDNTRNKVKNLYSILYGAGDNTVADENKFSHLKKLADKEPEIIINGVTKYKGDVSALFEKIKSDNNFLDLTTDGEIVVGKSKKEVLLKDIPAKGEGMLDYVFENYLDADIFEAIIKLNQIVAKQFK